MLVVGGVTGIDFRSSMPLEECPQGLVEQGGVGQPVPDSPSGDQKSEAHRQSAAIAQSEQEADDQAFVDAISADADTPG
jgi:hypothetical protein